MVSQKKMPPIFFTKFLPVIHYTGTFSSILTSFEKCSLAEKIKITIWQKNFSGSDFEICETIWSRSFNQNDSQYFHTLKFLIRVLHFLFSFAIFSYLKSVSNNLDKLQGMLINVSSVVEF